MSNFVSSEFNGIHYEKIYTLAASMTIRDASRSWRKPATVSLFRHSRPYLPLSPYLLPTKTALFMSGLITHGGIFVAPPCEASGLAGA